MIYAQFCTFFNILLRLKMKKFRFFLVLLLCVLPLALSAKAIGPSVSNYRGTELKWEDGAYGYHVMFKSLLSNTEADSDINNPQGDTCLDSSTYVLDATYLPLDAIIEDAYLVWTGAVPVVEKDDPTDNEVTLSFQHESNTGISSTQTIKGKKAYKVSEAGFVDFEFDAFKDASEPNKSWFTYRVKVVDFFKALQQKGRELETDQSGSFDGSYLYGSYTLSGLKCASDAIYKGSTEMVSGWSIILIYTSATISPKKVYLYDGFKPYYHELSEISVSGFEFPTDPEIRLTLASHEGDPGLATLNPETGMLYEEGIQVQGDGVDWLLISNECNPPAYLSDNFATLNYTEIFNSISSVYDYTGTNLQCIGGVPGALNYDEIEYGMDMDTFVLDTANDGGMAAHFHKGGTNIKLRIGANQDQAITNFMLVSVDTKTPQFDIPGQPEKVACTPANTPVSAGEQYEGKWCQNNIEHTFAMRIQNWGTDLTKNISVVDTIPTGMEYVPGSTEYANDFVVENGKKIAKKWIPIPDDAGGFPLVNGVKVADSLNFCKEGEDYLSCNDLVIVRFRAKVRQDTAKNHVIENTALYRTPGVVDYKTNLGISSKLRMISTGCVTSQDAVDLSDCGGVGAASCTSNDECGAGKICDKDSGSCIDDPKIVKCQNASVSVAAGKNSQSSDNIIIIPNPSNELVLGQIDIIAAETSDCFFNLDSVRLRVDVNDSSIAITDLKMYNDMNNDGKLDSGDVLLGSADALSSGYAGFTSSDPTNRLWANKRNSIIFVANANFNGANITNSTTFSPMIESEGVNINGGNATVDGLPVEFAKYQFMPTEGFVVTTGEHDPAVPAKSKMNGTHDVFQIKLLSIGEADTITRITIAVPKSSQAQFGSAITSLALYEDTNNDGVGDVELAKTNSFDANMSHRFNLNYDIPADTEKYLTIRANLSLTNGQEFQVQVKNLNLKNTDKVIGTPLNSRKYVYEDDIAPDGDDGGCALTVVEDSQNLFVMLLAATGLLAAMVLRRFASK